MPRIIACILLSFMPGLAGVRAQEPSADPAPAQPTPEHLEDIDRCRESILDAEARPVERLRWAEQVFSYDSSHARALIVELLGLSDRPDVQRALCRVIVERARRNPDLLDEALIQPLVDLLGAEAGDLRATAAEALAGFPASDVPEILGALASREDAPMVKRLAAIDALALNIHRREVVAQLIALLDVGTPGITNGAVTALEPAARETLGAQPERWKQWWAEKSRLSEEAWLLSQVQINRARWRALNEDFEAHRENTRRRQGAIIERLRGFQRDVFRALSEDQKNAKLAEWLSDPLDEIKLTALGIIKGRIADVGQRPQGEVLDRLLILLRQGSPQTRQEVLLIVQNLSENSVIQAVLDQLREEEDAVTRHAIFKAIGKLDRPEAIPALILEIATPESTPDCVREAARALGTIASKSGIGDDAPDAVAALKGRYTLAAPDDVPLRAALLSAMAGVGDPSFKGELLDAVESDDPNILRPAIRGLRAIGDVSKLTRLRDHTAHGDPSVRLAAIEAVGQLGREDADVECLLPRLNPAIESNEPAREAAWRAFRALLGDKPLPERIRAAERLRDMPELEVRYLSGLADGLPSTNGDSAELEAIRDRLATIQLERGNRAEAVPYLRDLYQMRMGRGDETALQSGLLWLDAVLHSSALQDAADVITQLATSFEGEQASEIVEVVQRFLESDELTADPALTREVLAQLQAVPPDSLPQAWVELLRRVSEDVGPDAGETVPPPSPP